ncbi:MAG TPA: helicase-related protein [Acidobacteriota bacterium]|jgi:superfamily II DNA or RNA helicase
MALSSWICAGIVWPECEVVKTEFRYQCSPDQWQELIGALAADPNRNSLVASKVREYLGPDNRALLLRDRIEHARLLVSQLGDLAPVLLTGDLSAAERKRGMRDVKAGARLTIATVHLLGEGVDVPGWDLLFLASPFSGGPRTLQAIGRVARPAPGKARALVVDFVDPKVPLLASAFRKRKALYAA